MNIKTNFTNIGKKSKSKQVTITLTESTIEQLDLIAKRDDLNKSAVIEELLKLFIAEKLLLGE